MSIVTEIECEYEIIGDLPHDVISNDLSYSWAKAVIRTVVWLRFNYDESDKNQDSTAIQFIDTRIRSHTSAVLVS